MDDRGRVYTVSRTEPSSDIFLAGDLIELLAKRIGADRATQWMEDKLGLPCNCEWRKQAVNRLDSTVRRFLGL